VASGISRVVYIEPFPKSLVVELYPDSIRLNGAGEGFKKVVFSPFVGIAPRLYERVFQAEGKRVKIDGEVVPWDKCSAVPIILDFSELNILTNEVTEIKELKELLENQQIIKKKGGK
jgi:cytidine deaminase